MNWNARSMNYAKLVVILVGVGIASATLPVHSLMFGQSHNIKWNNLQLSVPRETVLVNLPHHGHFSLLNIKSSQQFLPEWLGKVRAPDSSDGRIYLFDRGAYPLLSTWKKPVLMKLFPGYAAEIIVASQTPIYLQCFASRTPAGDRAEAHYRLIIELSGFDGSLGFTGTATELHIFIEIAQNFILKLVPSARANTITSCITQSLSHE